MKLRVFASLCILLFLAFNIDLVSQDDEDCIECHGEKSFSVKKNGKRISLYINYKQYSHSVHSENSCISCHSDIDDLPHEEDLKKVNCANCHDEVVEKYNKSLHGFAHRKGKFQAPYCTTCHSKHNILSHKNGNSPTYVMNIPALCGSCHKEGTPVSKLKAIKEKNILKNYYESIHGEGLFKRGLKVTAVCTSCHNSHSILPPENPNSSINGKNIPKTCMQCHSNIEKVHQKVIDGKLWESKPHEIPICVDCHKPHKVRSVFYDKSFTNKLCISCHSKKTLYNNQHKSLYVNQDSLKLSVHKDIPCVQCHTNVSYNKKPVCINSGKVDCSMCHAEVEDNYLLSTHGVQNAKGNKVAPYCTNCHGIHNIKSKKNKNSRTYRTNIPNLCGDCHREGNKAAKLYLGKDHNILSNYKMSIHGKGLLESGLMVTATCIDCHTSHRELPADNPNSSVNDKNISQTCAKCHSGIQNKFQKSVHSPLITKTDKKLPVCKDCHLSHTVNRVDLDSFREGIISKCGKCHKEVTKTYFDTFHGKVSKLGSAKTAKCYDCHGSHNILKPSDPNSTLSIHNIVKTCKKCHPNSNRKFVGYLTHATHHNKDKYPYLHYTFWFMTILLVSTFGFFGLHTLLWLPRALVEKRKKKKLLKATDNLDELDKNKEIDSKDKIDNSNLKSNDNEK